MLLIVVRCADAKALLTAGNIRVLLICAAEVVPAPSAHHGHEVIHGHSIWRDAEMALCLTPLAGMMPITTMPKPLYRPRMPSAANTCRVTCAAPCKECIDRLSPATGHLAPGDDAASWQAQVSCTKIPPASRYSISAAWVSCDIGMRAAGSNAHPETWWGAIHGHLPGLYYTQWIQACCQSL